MKFINIYILFLLITFTTLCQTYQTRMHPFSGTVVLILDGGIAISKTDYLNSKTGGRITGGAEYYIPTSSNHIFGIKGYFGGQVINNEEKNKIITIPGVGPDTLPDLIKTDMYVLGIGLIYSYSINDRFFPYISGGISNLWFSPKLDNGRRAPRNSANEYKRNSTSYDLEMGIKYSFTENFSIKLEGGFHYPNTDYIDDISTGKNKDFYATGTLGISYSLFGNKDSDEDGILNDIDQCPDEPEDYDGFEDDDGCPDLDNDGDGILDISDKCPDEPENKDGFQDDDGCPDIDIDRDGILDINDNCPNEPEDIDGFQDNDGCPDLDNDRDGISDQDDECPNEPESFNGFKDDDGCPDTVKSTNLLSAPEEILIEGELTFFPGTADIRKDTNKELDRIVKLLRMHPDSYWRIEGHTDSHDASNLMVPSLSLRRAEAILNYFVSRGLPSYQFQVFDMGDKFPIANNNTEYGRMKNRRVVLVREN